MNRLVLVLLLVSACGDQDERAMDAGADAHACGYALGDCTPPEVCSAQTGGTGVCVPVAPVCAAACSTDQFCSANGACVPDLPEGHVCGWVAGTFEGMCLPSLICSGSTGTCVRSTP